MWTLLNRYHVIAERLKEKRYMILQKGVARKTKVGLRRRRKASENEGWCCEKGGVSR